MTDSNDRVDGLDDQGAPDAPESPPVQPKEEPQQSLLMTRLTWRGVLVVLAAIAIIRLFIAESVIVDGNSMTNTLFPDEKVLVLKLLKPKRFSVVVLTDPESSTAVIKRVIGLPGDTIAIAPKLASRHLNFGGSQVLLDGAVVDEPYARSVIPQDISPTLVPEGSYFVLGDNRDSSVDSREYGTIERRALHGLAVAVIYPFSRMHIISHHAVIAPTAVVSAGANAPVN